MSNRTPRSPLGRWTICLFVAVLPATVRGGTITLVGGGNACEYSRADVDAAGNIRVICSLPGAPTILTATGQEFGLSVTYAPPASSGASSIIDYALVCTPASGGSAKTATGSGTSLALSGLTGGSTYNCTVSARNSQGSGPASAVTAIYVPAGAVQTPGAPQNVLATPGKGRVTFTYSPPASNGGAVISGYLASCNSPGKTTRTASGSSPLTVKGLVGGRSYSCAVAAVNSAGVGASSTSVAVMPAKTDISDLLMLLLN